MTFTCLCFIAGPSSVQYQHGTPVLYQAQSGSPPAAGLPRVSLPTSQQGPAGHATVPLAQGIPQQQQVACWWRAHFTVLIFLHVWAIWIWRSVQVTIQVQEVELGAGTQRQGGFLATPGGHRVLGKQLSADNAESHRWFPAFHHVSVRVPTVKMEKWTMYFFHLFYSLLWHVFTVFFLMTTCVSLCGTNFLHVAPIFSSLFITRLLYVTAGQDMDLC